MKKPLIGSYCILLWFTWILPGWAQEQPPQAPPEPPSNAPREPTATPTIQPPPLPPRVPDVRQPGERGFFLGVTGWFPTEHPLFDKGHTAYFLNPSRIELQGKPKYVPGAEVGIAVGTHNTIRISAFRANAAGNTVTDHDITLLGLTYAAGTEVSTSYRLQNVKVSFEYLTWPYPVGSRRFRLKTLWQVQYTQVRTAFNAPLLPTTDSSGNPITDSLGNALTYAASKTKAMVMPTLGLGVAEYVSPRFRLEANGSGFAIPHHGNLWDADASANFRVSHFELRVGAKGFHFNTSAAGDFYTRGTLYSAFAGIRWYSD